MNMSLVFQQNDPVLIFTFLLLITCSVATWTIVLFRLWAFLRTRRALKEDLSTFFDASDLRSARTELEHSSSPVANMAKTGIDSIGLYQDSHKTLGENCSLDEYLLRVIRNAMNVEFAKMETGLSVLASIGSSAPFIGLFGTVWGIYHALIGIAEKGEASIDVVAGPMGEALVSTAIGLAAAIPAVLAYNAFVRGNHVVQAKIDTFAHDLHHTLIGARLFSALK